MLHTLRIYLRYDIAQQILFHIHKSLLLAIDTIGIRAASKDGMVTLTSAIGIFFISAHGGLRMHRNSVLPTYVFSGLVCLLKLDPLIFIAQVFYPCK